MAARVPIGASGELPANPRHGALLVRRLLDYQVSAVVDFYELKLPERRRFVKLFLEAIVHLPRELGYLVDGATWPDSVGAITGALEYQPPWAPFISGDAVPSYRLSEGSR